VRAATRFLLSEARDIAERAVAERDEALEEVARVGDDARAVIKDALLLKENAETERDEALKALEWAAGRQRHALRIIEENGFIFDDIGNEPGNWQHLAFTLYSELCEIESRIRPLCRDK
jgi:hypothetical protein